MQGTTGTHASRTDSETDPVGHPKVDLVTTEGFPYPNRTLKPEEEHIQ